MPSKKTQHRGLAAAIATAASGSLLTINMAGVFLLQADPFSPPPYIPPQEPREYLAEQCQNLGYDCTLLDTIAFCESSWHMVQNAHSSAYGYFQIIDSTERTTPQYAEGRRKYDPYTNIDMALYLYGKRGSSPWNESRGCWSWRYRQALWSQAQSE